MVDAHTSPKRKRGNAGRGAALPLPVNASSHRRLGGSLALPVTLVALLALLTYIAPRATAQALSPAEALKRFQTAEGFDVNLVASEPDVRQPVTMTFDERGRIWVIQYLQYPTPAGLKPVTVDRYLRTKYDRRPEPPPHGPRGADKITILEDTDGDGRLDRAKDFVTGLNLASALALGDGGVYVGQAPYLLFYPDRDHDDVPDGDPDVLLTGFGLEDAHAVVNSLQWGPDGWLYGAQGSTVTADIRGIGFQQGIWRYHPPTERFELFSEGGGNTWGLDFDRAGNVISGTNWGDAVCLHQVQGGYYVKGFSKHGPLHNPYTYGYFDHVKHSGHVGGHVTCGGIVYQADLFPAAFRDCYLGPNLLSNEIYWHRFERAGSTVTSHFQGTLLKTDDPWFRPIDSLVGPDGALYVVDWYDQRANHVIPEDTWDKTNGRIWRVAPRGAAPLAAFDLSKLTSDQLIERLGHANAWHRREARRILRERNDAAILPRLTALAKQSADAPLALEALWTLYSCDGWSEALAIELLDHPSADVRAWTVRFTGDPRQELSSAMHERLVRLATGETGPTVRSQLACTAKRLRAGDGLPIVAQLLRHDEDAADPHIPLLLWWAIEDKATTDRESVLSLLTDGAVWQRPLVRQAIVERLAKRYLAEQTDAGYASCARLLALAPERNDVLRLVTAMEQDLTGPRLSEPPAALAAPLEKLWQAEGSDPTVTRLAMRLGVDPAFRSALKRLADPAEPQAVRLSFISAAGQAASPEALAAVLPLVDPAQPDAIVQAALGAAAHYEDPVVTEMILTRYDKLSSAARARAIGVLASRQASAVALVAAVAEGRVDAKDVNVDVVRQMLAHNDAALNTAIEARWGRIRPATPGEKMAYVPVLGRVLNAGQGDLTAGRELFTKHCAVCHTLHGQGNKVGPDLTSADRKNRDALLVNILDPSGYVRPEYVAQVAVLNDGRVLTGLVVESSAQQLTIVDAKNQKTTVARGEIEEIQPSTQSLMPERLLETLQPQELRDLFRFLQSDAPAGSAAN